MENGSRDESAIFFAQNHISFARMWISKMEKEKQDSATGEAGPVSQNA